MGTAWNVVPRVRVVHELFIPYRGLRLVSGCTRLQGSAWITGAPLIRTAPAHPPQHHLNAHGLSVSHNITRLRVVYHSRQDNDFAAYTADTPAGPWTLASANMLPERPHAGANFRPKLLFNKANRQYVMWFNFQTPTPNVPGYYTVATASKPWG